MSNVPRPEVAMPLVAGGLTMLVAGAALWAWIARRLARRQAVLPFQPRRPVPWGGLDLVLVVLFFLVATYWVTAIDGALFGLRPQPAPAVAQSDADANHPLVVLLRQDPSLVSLAWCLAAAVLVAPVAEEILFRLLFQGWLEAVERRLRRLRRLPRVMPGLLPVLVASVAFALLHYREAEPAVDPRWLLRAMARGMLVYLLTVTFAVALVQQRVGATAADLGFSAARFWPDVRLGLLSFVAICVPVYLLQLTLSAVLPSWLAPDPITMVFFAMALGFLYYRTHRIVPSIVLHMALNGTSLALAWLLLSQGAM